MNNKPAFNFNNSRRFSAAAGLVMLSILWSIPAIAAELLDADEIVSIYKKRCIENIEEFRKYLDKQKVKVRGSDKLATKSYIFECDIRKGDSGYDVIADGKTIKAVTKYIRLNGHDSYIRSAKKDLHEQFQSFEYSKLLEKVERDGMTQLDFEILETLTKTKSLSEAMITVVQSLPK